MDICPVCGKKVSEKCNSIQCDICDLWVHQFRCSGLSHSQFRALCEQDSQNWYCQTCINSNLPGSDVYIDLPSKADNPSPSLSVELKTLLSDFNKVVTGTTASDEDEEENIQFHNNICSYADCNELNRLISQTKVCTSAFHLNIASISKHYNELINLLALIKQDFSFIGISETRSLCEEDDEPENIPLEHKDDYPIPGYKKFFTPTESSAGGVSLYVLKNLTHKPRDDLSRSCYQPLNLESVFVEIILSNRPNIIVGNIYRHPCMAIKTFNSDYFFSQSYTKSNQRKSKSFYQVTLTLTF